MHLSWIREYVLAITADGDVSRISSSSRGLLARLFIYGTFLGRRALGVTSCKAFFGWILEGMYILRTNFR